MSITDTNIRLNGLKHRVRLPSVAGMFYPGDAGELRRIVGEFLDQAEVDVAPPKAIIVPHAGYIYSGTVAAHAYAAIRPIRNRICKVVLLGPAHRAHVEGLALPRADFLATPLGQIPLDRELVDRIRPFPQVHIMDEAFDGEHSLEVHLPFLQTVLDRFTLLPLVVGRAGTDDVSRVLRAVWGGDETLIVISSDLSHYHDYQTARAKDAATSRLIEGLELENIGPYEACGCYPLRGLLDIARDTGMRIRTLDQRNSGDTAGSRDRVVGYGAYAVQAGEVLTRGQRRQLLDIASSSIERGFTSRRPLQVDSTEYEDHLRQPRAAFVTLKLDSMLRGCIGTTSAAEPLVQCVANNAFNAAFHDPRFPQLTEEEFARITISISVLSTPRNLNFTSRDELLRQLEPGRDGLIIEKGAARATFLPEVWESIPEPVEFLRQLQRKAGMSATDTPERAWIYSSEHIT